MNEACAMEVTLPVLSEQDRPELRREPRRSVQEGVALRMIVADKAGLASGQVIDMTTRGCGLRLTKPLTRGQYLTLKVYPNDGTATVQWVEAERAGVTFLSMSRENELRLHPLCGGRFGFAVEG